MSNSDNNGGDNNDDVVMTDLSLLQQTRKLIHVEKHLTKILNEAEPWLPNAVAHPHRRRVRPIPSTMDQVESILALARKYAAQTSAPAGWNPAAPVVGFATPSPLPNQLRAGCLAALQLERAQDERKRQREQQEQAAKKEEASKQQHTSEAAAAARNNHNNDEPDPKRREVMRQDKHHHNPQRSHAAGAARAPPPQKAIVDSMRLSDSEDSDDDE